MNLLHDSMRLTNKGKKNIKQCILFAIIMMGLNERSHAQLKPLGASFFQNQYLNNPAFAGFDKGLNINLAYRNQNSSIPGSLKEQSLTAEYQLKKSGMGINLSNERAGLIKSTRTVISYAYHLPLNEFSRLHFGVSAGIMNERLDNTDISGDINDPDISNFNNRGTYFDGDFGFAFTNRRLTLQGTIPNINNFLDREQRETVNYTTVFSAASYRCSLSEEVGMIEIEPKVCFRGLKGVDNVVDLGANISFQNNKFNFYSMYHSSKNATFGMGVHFSSVNISGIYSTETSTMKRYTNGNFEIGIGLNLF